MTDSICTWILWEDPTESTAKTVWWNGLRTGFTQSMTIYDVLCYSKDSCSLSGKFCSINMLKGIVKANPPGVNLFQKAADSFNGKVAALDKACESFGE